MLPLFNSLQYPMSFAEAIQEIKQASLNERLKALDELWESVVEEENSVPISDWQAAIIQERLRDYDNNPTAGEPWSKVKNRILK